MKPGEEVLKLVVGLEDSRGRPVGAVTDRLGVAEKLIEVNPAVALGDRLVSLADAQHGGTRFVAVALGFWGAFLALTADAATAEDGVRAAVSAIEDLSGRS
ncbi:MAG: hypothetical protein QM619_05420 [Micropruina sp.]|uniref:hypothetical protein n=1 Tax=Micropruina sp. TaxID=2737536 RepID=UPI0039E32C26